MIVNEYHHRLARARTALMLMRLRDRIRIERDRVGGARALILKLGGAWPACALALQLEAQGVRSA